MSPLALGHALAISSAVLATAALGGLVSDSVLRWAIGGILVCLGVIHAAGHFCYPSTRLFKAWRSPLIARLVGLSQGVALDAIFSLTIVQTGGNVTGSWALQGTLFDGVQSASVQGTGNLSGTVAAGTNPSVNLTIRTGSCPNYQANFSGAFDSANQRLTISGPVEFFAPNSCNVALTYQGTIILNR